MFFQGSGKKNSPNREKRDILFLGIEKWKEGDLRE
jgi:hypothetical protein